MFDELGAPSHSDCNTLNFSVIISVIHFKGLNNKICPLTHLTTKLINSLTLKCDIIFSSSSKIKLFNESEKLLT